MSETTLGGIGRVTKDGAFSHSFESTASRVQEALALRGQKSWETSLAELYPHCATIDRDIFREDGATYSSPDGLRNPGSMGTISSDFCRLFA